MYKGLEDYESGEDSAENIVNHPDGTFSSVQISRPTRRQARVLLPGKYRFPFGFRLPPWLPPSYYYSTFMAKGKNQYTAKAVLMIMKHYDNYTDEKDPDLYNNKVKKELTTKLNFFVLTAMSKRQLLRAYREASKTLSRVPNCLSARYQVFRCGFFGNMCCFLPNGGIEVEVEVLGSKALIMKRDAHAEDLICQEQKKLRESKDDTGEEKETTEWVFPPFPAEQLPIKIYVRNELSSKSIPAVKVELVEMIDVFKPLEASHTLHPPLAKVQYKKKIAPGQSMEWETNLILPKYFRRCKGDGGSYLPPPGIQTANIRTYVSLVIKFPGLNTYIEEQDWDSHVLNIAELLDTDNQVLNLPVKYS
ncbi:hypothetical protein AGDE_13354 [Angomonas deanei]|uniref:Arrestin (Or S-antigen), N-terminal domain containing protein, putative n=1 Tax=Angomonas deanei TaxID=59799 RepID=A0A7G2C4V0_9TRYP|nr:hypothetical protein AGDE_13354 [Angomonas deanei]CAD2214639.1 Arrestin (or S-antigen), N-terminal domain containing protein, putative [Angomonas deanei]|eukprot:EPY22401.1 hypothetical protein AGDE_13354 [Angomonas deanei]